MYLERFNLKGRVAVVTGGAQAIGLACVEALAHGLPVIATDCGGPAEILVAPVQGTLVPVGDVEALARALRLALADPGDPAPRQARAREFSLEAARDHYGALIGDVVMHARSPVGA